MKKYLSILLAAALALSLFTACGGAQTSENPATPSSQPESQTTTSAEQGPWKPIGTADAPVKVSFVLKDVFPDEPDVIALLEEMEKKMAAHNQFVDIELMNPPAESYGTALPLAIRSGEMAPDIVYFQGGDLPIAQEGLLEDLTGYIEGSTYVKAMMDDSNKEKLKSYPYLLWLATPRVSVPVMRKDFAEGLDSYKTLTADPTVDNYYAFFKEMVDKKLVQYATDMDGSTTRLDFIFDHAFGVTAPVVQEDGKWIYSMTSKGQKEKLAFYAKLYKDGLLDPGYITDAWDAMEQKFYEGKVGVLASTAGDVIQIYDQKMKSANGEAASLVVLPPAKGISQGYTVDITKEPRGFAILSESPNKDAAFAVFEFMASPEGRLLDKVGIEGTHYNVTDGKIVFTEKFPEWWARFWPTPLNLNPETPLAQPVLTAAAQSSVDESMKYLKSGTNVIVPSEMAPQYDAMKALYDEYSTDIITGKRDISAFDEFVTKFNAAGGTTFTEYFATVLK